ncbi:MAG: hypothetical protein J6V97_09275 [Prevotella sp.]|nr:hypothetical protein [Prevotella sp.]
MDKNELSLHRSRSIQAVLRDGYRLFGQNFSRLLRSSWIQAVFYALAFGFTMAFFFTNILPLLMEHRSLSSELLPWIGSILLFVIAAILLAVAGGVAPLQQHAQTDAISGPRHWWGRWPWKLTLRSIVRLPKMLWMVLRRQLGRLVSICLVMLLAVLVTTMLFMLPAVVMAIANIEASTGRAAGDAVQMPENLFTMNFATFAVCGLLQAYIHLTTLFPLYYLWGNGKGEKVEK